MEKVIYTVCIGLSPKQKHSMRKEQFVKGEWYHIYNRGVDKRIIFTSDRERLRFIHSMYLFNNFQNIPQRLDVLKLEPREFLIPIEPYVDIVAACLMPNHYHFLMSPLQDGGISKFLHKVGLSYTNYFNKLHERKGRLFESTFKAKHVDSHDYATYLTQYIHLNPVDLFRTKSGTKETLSAVKTYPWSSLPIYLGKVSPFSILISDTFRGNILALSSTQYSDYMGDLYRELFRT